METIKYQRIKRKYRIPILEVGSRERINWDNHFSQENQFYFDRICEYIHANGLFQFNQETTYPKTPTIPTQLQLGVSVLCHLQYSCGVKICIGTNENPSNPDYPEKLYKMIAPYDSFSHNDGCVD